MPPTPPPAVDLPEFWRLGDADIDLGLQRLRRDGREIRLTPRAAALLRALLACGDRPLTREAALDQVWGEQITGDEVIGRAINELRQALGDTDSRARRCIETIPKRGYRLMCAPVALAHSPLATTPADAGTAAEAVDALPGITQQDAATPVAKALPASGDAGVAAPAPGWRSGRWRPWAWMAAVALAALGAWSWLQAVDDPLDRWMVRLQRALPMARELLPAHQSLGYAELLPDGSALLAPALRDGAVRLRLQPLPNGPPEWRGDSGSGHDFAPAISSDGRQLAWSHFEPSSCRMRLLPAADSAPRDLAACGLRFAEWISFSPEGDALIVPRLETGGAGVRLHRLRLADATLMPLDYEHAPLDHDVEARSSPDGRWLAFRRGPQPTSALWLWPAAGGTGRTLVPDTLGLDGFAWLPDSSGLVHAIRHGRDAGLWLVDLQGKRRYLGKRGAVRPLMDRAGRWLAWAWSAQPIGIAEARIDGAAEAAEHYVAAGASGSDWWPRLAPDGRRLAFLSDRGGALAVYLATTDGAKSVQALPALPGWEPDAMPAFAANGEALLVPMHDDLGHHAVFETRLDRPQWLRLGGVPDHAEQVWASPDGRWLYLVVAEASSRALWRQSRETGATQRLHVGLERGPLSGDRAGRVHFIDATRQTLLRLAPGDATPEVVLTDMGYWTAHAWTVSGDVVFALMEPAGTAFGLYRIAAPGASPELLEPLDGVAAQGLAVEADGARLYLGRTRRQAWRIEGVALEGTVNPL